MRQRPDGTAVSKVPRVSQVLCVVLQLVIAASTAGAQGISRGTSGTSGSSGTRSVSGASAAAAPPVSVHARLSRTAAFVGEPVIYTIVLRCAPGVDVLLEDLGRDRLQVDGGEITQIDAEQEDSGEALTRRMHYTLVSFDVETSDIRVGALRVRYYARDASGGANQAAPAGEILVPATTIALRSTIADWDAIPEPRVPDDVHPLPDRVRLARPIGWTLVALAILPLLLWSANVSGRARAVLVQYKNSRRRRQRPSIAELQRCDPRSDHEYAEAFARLDRVLRDYISNTTDIPAHALTPEEIGNELGRTKTSLPQGVVAELLSTCERVRYAPLSASPDWPQALRDIERVLRP